ncbi:MAG TPA: hypothetical protein VJH34_02455 [archaeon]|nr:hypothetical protein [archaeon]
MQIRGVDERGGRDVFNLNLNLADPLTGKVDRKNIPKVGEQIREMILKLASKYNAEIDWGSGGYSPSSNHLGLGGYMRLVYFDEKTKKVYETHIFLSGCTVESTKYLPQDCLNGYVLPAYLKPSKSVNRFENYEINVHELQLNCSSTDVDDNGKIKPFSYKRGETVKKNNELYQEAKKLFDEFAITPEKWILTRKQLVIELEEKSGIEISDVNKESFLTGD